MVACVYMCVCIGQVLDINKTINSIFMFLNVQSTFCVHVSYSLVECKSSNMKHGNTLLS